MDAPTTQAITFAGELVRLIGAGRDADARRLLDAKYHGIYALIQGQPRLQPLRTLLFEIDEYLSWPEARRAGAISRGIVLSSWDDLRADGIVSSNSEPV